MGKDYVQRNKNKHRQPEKEEEENDYSYDSAVVSDKEDVMSVDSEEAALNQAELDKKNSRKVGKVQDRDSTFNKLNLGQFHRNASFKPRVRKVTTKKQIRDIERLLDREGLPEEMRTAKKAQLVELKKDAKKRREAELFESKYKKIKFTEKRKVIRMMEASKKSLKDNTSTDRDGEQAKLKVMQDQLTYINHFPVTQKYISLFPFKEDENSIKRRQEAMVKVLQLASHKNMVREKDLQEELQGEDMGQSYRGA